MGSTCSRAGRGGSSIRRNNSSFRSFPQVYENSDSSEVYYRESVLPVDIEDSSSNFGLQSPFTSSNAQTNGSFETHNQVALVSESEQQHVNQGDLIDSDIGNLDDASVTVQSGRRDGLVAVGDGDRSMNDAASSNFLQNVNSSHFIHDLGSISTNGQSGMNFEDEDIVQSNSDVASRSLGLGSPVTLLLLGLDSSRETSQGSRDLLSGAEEQDLGSGSHIDMVSISSNSFSSNIREVSTRELRSRGRRSFWDVFSRRNLRRHSDIPAILFAIDGGDDLGVRGRLLLDIDRDQQNYISAHDWATRGGNRNGQRQSWLERSQNFQHGTSEEYGNRHVCASGVHQHGTCTCGDEFGTLVRISRIVILVEAINELLDVIQSQTMPFSVSTVSLPAPESIVNSFPLKNHNKLNIIDSSEEAQQCYICLAEYEEGEIIRILPCKHEYHMACVDKWLKEVNGICPLCRADVSISSHPQTTDAEA